MIKGLLEIDHEFTWDQMYGGVLPRDANPFRKARTTAPESSADQEDESTAPSLDLPCAGTGTPSEALRDHMDATSRDHSRKRR